MINNETHTVHLTYLYNCGVLLSCGEDRILIDGLFGKENNFFDILPDEYEQALLSGKAPFEDITALLFTHCHGDHYSRRLVDQYMQAFPQVQVISPETVLTGDSGAISCGSLKIEYSETGHIPTGRDEGRHYVFGIAAGGRNLVFTGDMDPAKLEDIIQRHGVDADAFFINPAMLLYEMKAPDKTLLQNIENLYVYHLPSEARDLYGYRKATFSSLNRIRTHLGGIKLLPDNMQDIEIG